MEDFRLFYAAETLEPEQVKELPAELLKEMAKEPVRSVRPNIPEELEYIGTRFYDNYCFDYYQLPDGTFRQEYRRKHQKIITRYLQGGKRHEKNRKDKHVHNYSNPLDVGDSQLYEYQCPQSDRPEISAVEHVHSDGEGCTGATKRGNFSTLPQ